MVSIDFLLGTLSLLLHFSRSPTGVQWSVTSRSRVNVVRHFIFLCTQESLTEDLLHRLGASPDILDQNIKNKENEASFRAPNSSSTPVANSNDKKLLMWNILSRISSPLHMMMKKDEMSVKEEREKGRQMSLGMLKNCLVPSWLCWMLKVESDRLVSSLSHVHF